MAPLFLCASRTRPALGALLCLLLFWPDGASNDGVEDDLMANPDETPDPLLRSPLGLPWDEGTPPFASGVGTPNGRNIAAGSGRGGVHTAPLPKSGGVTMGAAVEAPGPPGRGLAAANGCNSLGMGCWPKLPLLSLRHKGFKRSVRPALLRRERPALVKVERDARSSNPLLKPMDEEQPKEPPAGSRPRDGTLPAGARDPDD